MQVIQPGDAELTCEQIHAELLEIDGQARVLAKTSDKQVRNVSLAAAGSILLVPLFFIDLSEAEKQELNALRARHMRLSRFKENNDCS